jgi:hypothetical protein
MIYLAIPYTFNAERSFKIANKVAARLMNEGGIVFSPITHSHPIADELDESLRYSQEFWLKQDLAFLRMCDRVALVKIGENGADLIANSKGVQTELKVAYELGLPIHYIEYNEEE